MPPTSPAVPQPSHVPTAVVISEPKISWSRPAAALPSSINASISSSCRAEALGLDSRRLVAELYEPARYSLDERCRATDERDGELRRSRPDFAEQVSVDTSAVAVPARRLCARKRLHDLEAVAASRELRELVSVDHIVPASRRVEQPRRNAAALQRALPGHRHQRHDSRTAPDEEHGALGVRVPDEVAADGTAQLDHVPGTQLIREVGRDLTVLEALDGQIDPRTVGRRRDRVAALCLIAVVCGQPDVDVLTRTVSGPPRHVEGDRLRLTRLRRELDDLRGAPVQSPQYRCSFHGSP